MYARFDNVQVSASRSSQWGAQLNFWKNQFVENDKCAVQNYAKNWLEKVRNTRNSPFVTQKQKGIRRLMFRLRFEKTRIIRTLWKSQFVLTSQCEFMIFPTIAVPSNHNEKAIFFAFTFLKSPKNSSNIVQQSINKWQNGYMSLILCEKWFVAFIFGCKEMKRNDNEWCEGRYGHPTGVNNKGRSMPMTY